MRRPIIAANWKMNKNLTEALAYVSGLCKAPEALLRSGEIVLAPPSPLLYGVHEALLGSGVQLSAQDLHWEDKGAFTGEVSGPILKDAGCRYVIVGHSERRHLFGETDVMVQKKISAALRHGIVPIFCVGETLQERQEGRTFEVISRQLNAGLGGLSAEQAAQIVIAYEPVWAIGTGQTATPDQAEEVHRYIRGHLKELCGDQVSEMVRIQYGGSVTPDNAADLMSRPEIDGALVGGASLSVESFTVILEKGFKSKGVLS